MENTSPENFEVLDRNRAEFPVFDERSLLEGSAGCRTPDVHLVEVENTQVVASPDLSGSRSVAVGFVDDLVEERIVEARNNFRAHFLVYTLIVVGAVADNYVVAVAEGIHREARVDSQTDSERLEIDREAELLSENFHCIREVVWTVVVGTRKELRGNTNWVEFEIDTVEWWRMEMEFHR